MGAITESSKAAMSRTETIRSSDDDDDNDDDDDDDDDALSSVSNQPTNAMRRLRKAVITQFAEETIEKMKLYVAVPVLRKIEEDQSLDYLSEMRQVERDL